jgi:hypothetical protein
MPSSIIVALFTVAIIAISLGPLLGASALGLGKLLKLQPKR